MTSTLLSLCLSDQIVVDVTDLTAAQREQVRVAIDSALTSITSDEPDSTPTAFEGALELADRLEETLGTDTVLRMALWRLAAGGHHVQRAIVAVAASKGVVSRQELLAITEREEGGQALNGITRSINAVSRALAEEGLVPDGDFLLTHPTWKRGVAVAFEADPLSIAEAKRALA